MAEMMSEEITKVMDEQRNLEVEYARLVQQRDQLKGINNKQKLLETKEQIMVSHYSQISLILNFNLKLIHEIIVSRQKAQGLNSEALPTVTKET